MDRARHKMKVETKKLLSFFMKKLFKHVDRWKNVDIRATKAKKCNLNVILM